MSDTTESNAPSHGHDVLITVLLLGSLWAFTEVVGDAAIRASGLPLRSMILVGIGMGWLGIASGRFARWWPLLAILGITVALKLLAVAGVQLLAVAALAQPVACKANSLIAIGLEAGALTLGMATGSRRVHASISWRIAIPFVALLGAGAAFFVIGRHAAPCPFLLSFSFTGFMVQNSLPWAIVSAVTVPLGYAFGQRTRDWHLIPAERHTLRVAVTTALVMLCFASVLLTVATT